MNRGSNTIRTSNVSDATTYIDVVHQQIYDGKHFFVSSYQDLSSGNVLDMTWLMPASGRIHFTWNIDCEDEINWFVYENVTANVALTSNITPLNSDRNSSTASGTVLKYQVHANVTNANLSTVVSGATTLASGITSEGDKFVAGGGIASRDTEIILKASTLYCLRAIAAANGYITFNMQWYEAS